MDFRILGPLEVAEDDVVVALGGLKQRALLAILLLSANEVVSSDRLIDELWGEPSPESGRTALQVRVSQLRKALGPAGAQLVTRAPGYVLRVDPGQLDLDRFERLVREADTAAPALAAAKLREALELWRGGPLADLSYESFAQSAVARMRELRITALEERIEADLALGRHNELAGELEALVAEHPLRERLRGQLMLTLYRCGRQADALEAYRPLPARAVLGRAGSLDADEKRLTAVRVGPLDRPIGLVVLWATEASRRRGREGSLVALAGVSTLKASAVEGFSV